MKKLRLLAAICLICCLLPGAAQAAGQPVWEKYAPDGGQLDDTAFPEVVAWLLQPGNREAALMDMSGQRILASRIVENARSLVDQYPYVYGGESPEEGGFDCTGLVWYVYNRMSGVDITLSQAGRSKSALAAAGELIYDAEDFLPGDVIQFTYSHVAIYVGDGRVVHARKTGTMVQETELYVPDVAYAVRYPAVVQSAALEAGELEGGLRWELMPDGVLTISGAGAMPDFGYTLGEGDTPVSTAPWSSYVSTISSLIVENGVLSIGDFAFYDCRSLQSACLPEGLMRVGAWAFSGCALSEIALPDGVDALEDYTFYGCSALKKAALPAKLTSIGYAAFYGCAALEEIAIPESVTDIGACAFWDCAALAAVHVPEGVIHMGEYLFCGCGSLADISIPASVEDVGFWAFSGCTALETVHYGGSPGTWEKIRCSEGNEPLLSARLICAIPVDAPVIGAETIPSSGKIRITWEPLPGAEQYEVWRAETKNGRYTKMFTTTNAHYTNTSAKPGETYYYKVRAVAGDFYGAFSAAKGKTCDLPCPTLTVTNRASTGKILLSWTAIEGAEEYEIWCSSEKNGTYRKLGTIAGTSAAHNSAKPGETYYYRVKAIHAVRSANSAGSAAVGKTCDLPMPVVSVSLSSKGKPVLTWEKIEGAESYEIWCAESKNGSYKKLGIVTGTRAVINSAVSGKTCYYRVKAVCAVSSAGSAGSVAVAVTAA